MKIPSLPALPWGPQDTFSVPSLVSESSLELDRLNFATEDLPEDAIAVTILQNGRGVDVIVSRSALLAGLGVIIEPAEQHPDTRECDACGDQVYTLSTDDLCGECVSEGFERCGGPNGCGEYNLADDMSNTNLGRICDSCIYNASRSGGQVVYTEGD